MNTVDTNTQAPAAARAVAYSFFGSLAPIERPVEWGGIHQNQVSFHILSGKEEQKCTGYARAVAEGATTSQQYLTAVTVARLAYALDAVDGKPVAEACPTVEDRVAMVEELPSPLIDSLIEAYSEARDEPLLLLSEMMEDAPGFEQNGSSSEMLDYGTADEG